MRKSLLACVMLIGVGLLVSCQGVPPGVKPPESGEQPPKIEEPKQPEQPPSVKVEQPKESQETIGQIGALSVTRLEVFPTNRIVLRQGTVAFNVYLHNPGTSEVTEDIALVLEGERLGSQKARLAPGETKHLHFQVQGFASSGPKTIELAGQKINITVIEPQPSRGGVIPEDAKVVSAPEGLAEPGVPGGKIVISTISGPKTLNPVVAQETSSTDITGLMHASLIETRWDDYTPAPGLAVAWEISDDKRELTLHLRRGVRWSDGTCCFTADDVLFTANDLHLNPEVNSAFRDLLYVEGKPLQFVKIDDYTVKVIMPKPFRPIFWSLTFDILPKYKLADKVAKLNPAPRDTLRASRKSSKTTARAYRASPPRSSRSSIAGSPRWAMPSTPKSSKESERTSTLSRRPCKPCRWPSPTSKRSSSRRSSARSMTLRRCSNKPKRASGLGSRPSSSIIRGAWGRPPASSWAWGPIASYATM
jgi:hypothetical protein